MLDEMPTSNSPPAIQQRIQAGRIGWAGPLVLTTARTGLILLVQTVVATAFLVHGDPSPWRAQAPWWTVYATLVDLGCLLLLSRQARREGIRLVDLFGIERSQLGREILWGLLYIEGFAERSKIRATLEFPDGFGRLSRELETAIFRVVQECLTNIHRHSGSPAATVCISRSATDVWVEVEDKGKGISPEKRAEIVSSGAMVGVGIRGMRERLRQLGGSLEINSEGSGKGTVVVTRLPLLGGRLCIDFLSLNPTDANARTKSQRGLASHVCDTLLRHQTLSLRFVCGWSPLALYLSFECRRSRY